MRLSKIKLAGFKSFVDPTNIIFPSNLVGVVGPNGCGKSNVIDAVRWVMGESSASRLRGESITDVIFNGSSSRKPVGAASVELHADDVDPSYVRGLHCVELSRQPIVASKTLNRQRAAAARADSRSPPPFARLESRRDANGRKILASITSQHVH